MIWTYGLPAFEMTLVLVGLTIPFAMLLVRGLTGRHR